ncbi:MAG TPA: MBG domain-containing protein, partial [Gammaproteobacteria bacterium]|nr:MBG domain-containing protein [Gammaproteobacteria bacterium]
GAAANASVGSSPYSITASNASGGTFTPSNYTISYNNGSLTVDPASLSITASNQSKTYGQTSLGTTAFISSGLQNGETIGSVTLTSPGAAASASVGSGPYTITASNASGGSFNPSNYTISYNNGSLTVDPASLSITANNQSKTFSETLSLGTTAFTSGGLQNGETIGSVTLTSSGAAASASVAGSPYAIIVADATGGTFNPSNYTISYINGSLIVNPISPEAINSVMAPLSYASPVPSNTNPEPLFTLSESPAAINAQGVIIVNNSKSSPPNSTLATHSSIYQEESTLPSSSNLAFNPLNLPVLSETTNNPTIKMENTNKLSTHNDLTLLNKQPNSLSEITTNPVTSSQEQRTENTNNLSTRHGLTLPSQQSTFLTDHPAQSSGVLTKLLEIVTVSTIVLAALYLRKPTPSTETEETSFTLDQGAQQLITQTLAQTLSLESIKNFNLWANDPSKAVNIRNATDAIHFLKLGLPKNYQIEPLHIGAGEIKVCVLKGPLGTKATFTLTGLVSVKEKVPS